MCPRHLQIPAWIIFSAFGLKAAVIVNEPQTTTNRVFINVIQFSSSTGQRAQDFGSPTQEKYIKDQTNLILNQAGIDIEFSPTITVIDDFAYDGFPEDYSNTTRPQNDLGIIRSGLEITPNFTDTEVINLYLVEIVPGFTAVSDNTSNGLAYVDRNGIAMHIGSNLVGFSNGRDVIASVLSHEIGHNLGLSHTANGIDNLMSPGGNTDQLTQSQIDEIYGDDSGVDGYDFAKPLSETNFSAYLAASGLAGDEVDDDDFDGLPNLLEFALGTDPALPDRSRLDVLQQVAAGSITFDFRKRASALEDGVTYFLEYNLDLNTPWQGVGAGSFGSTLIEDSDFRLAGINSNGGTEFMRLRVARTAPASMSLRSASKLQSIAREASPADDPIADCNYHRTVIE